MFIGLLPPWAHLLRIGLKTILDDVAKGKLHEFMMVLGKLGLPPVSNFIVDEKISKAKINEYILELVNKEWQDHHEAARNRLIWPVWKPVGDIRTFTTDIKFLLGTYDFRFDHKQICECRKGCKTPLHKLLFCPISGIIPPSWLPENERMDNYWILRKKYQERSKIFLRIYLSLIHI